MNFYQRILLSMVLMADAAFADDYQVVLAHLHLPAGFSIAVYADKLPNARSMALADDGTVFIGTGLEGKVYAVRDSNHDGKADERYELATDLYMPNGVAFKNGALYVAEVNRIIRFDDITRQLQAVPEPVVVFSGFPSDQHHGWKYLRFGPDGKLYTAVGAPCNICDPKEIYTSLVRLNADGSGFEILARGIRNTVGFDWSPQTRQLYFTDNGRDYLGEDVPPEELNLWTEKGQHFGYPYCHGGSLPDPEFAGNHQCREFTPPVWKFNAHMAALGIRFYRGQHFPADYKNQLFVAQHGSWNRSQPQGYRVALVKFSNGVPVSDKVFIDGWLQPDGEALGRPVDILELNDGSVLISDDKLGVIYRVTYKP
ncbi:MAG: sorbosone dehydrogenase [Methylobacter sp.]|nr:MAG: sorbosone dehydrogenase [Methylobacter sp.]